MLEGENVNLRVMEREDLPLFAEWFNNPEFLGEYSSPLQMSKAEMEKMLENNPFEMKGFIIEKKDGTKIGQIGHFNMLSPYAKMLEIGYAVVPGERRKGYCTEAAQLMVDYLFLSKDIARIQATTHVRNEVSQKVLQKVGFRREGTLRKAIQVRGENTDLVMFSIIREEWKEPRILTKTA